MSSDSNSTAPDGRPESEQPAWRSEFPIDLPQDHYIARRDFTRFLVLTSLAFAAGQVWIGLQNLMRRRQGKPPIARICALDEVPVGGARLFRYPEPEDACILVRPTADKLCAYSQKCTHLCCAVVPSVADKQLHCPCHKGVFDLDTGRPISGPPRRPLPRIDLEVVNGDIYATFVELRTV